MITLGDILLILLLLWLIPVAARFFALICAAVMGYLLAHY